MGEPRYWTRLERDVLSAVGPEAETYLQGQLSQDLAPVPPGGSAWSWLLAPTGKVDALIRVSRAAPGGWLIDADAGWGEAVLARLQRFKLRSKVDLTPVPASVVGLRGDGWDLPEPAAAAGPADAAGPAVVAVPPWPGLAGADLLYPGVAAQVPELVSGWPESSPDAYQAVRIRAGQPRMGAELGEKTIPGETGLVPFTVSFTKGCYTGQELVARIDSRGGNVPRRLYRLRLAGPAEPGAELLDGDTAVGTLTSAAAGADGLWVGLGYVRRGVEPPRPLTAGAGGPAADLETLPW